LRCDVSDVVGHDGGAVAGTDADSNTNTEEEQRFSFVLQDEALLLRKQALLQKVGPRLLHRRPCQGRMLLQKGLVSDAGAAERTQLIYSSFTCGLPRKPHVGEPSTPV
jgi:hypothetical protein